MVALCNYAWKIDFFVCVIRTSFTGVSTYPIYNSNTNTEVTCVTNKTCYAIQLLKHYYLNYYTAYRTMQ